MRQLQQFNNFSLESNFFVPSSFFFYLITDRFECAGKTKQKTNATNDEFV